MAQIIDQTELESAVALSLTPGVGPQLHITLVDHFGSAKQVLAASRQALREIPGIGTQLVDRITAASVEDARRELETCRQHDIGVRLSTEENFPRNLREINCPPPVIFTRGALEPQDALAIAIVGTRHATHYGRRVARRLASSLASAGMTIISGLARGIDAAAHEGALEAGGRTLAVFAGGLRNVYPEEHKELAYDISENGALISEFPANMPVSRGSFPRRNRIITGLSLGVIVVEAGDRSGALISAQHAMEQGRDVFAVPGPIDSRVSRGCHELLRDGATLVESADDVFEALGPLAETAQRATGEEVRHPAELKLNEQEKLVLDFVEMQPTSIDAIAAATALPIHRVLATISVLETRRLIRRVSGQLVARI